MVAAFIKPHFYHGPLVARNVIFFHSALTLDKIVATACVEISPSADNIDFFVVFNTIREVGALQIHTGPASESLTLDLEFPVLPRVAATYQERPKRILCYNSSKTPLSH
jgi:hypothetical protein